MAILSSGDITVICEPTGPSMEDAERVQGALAKNDQFLAAIGGTNYRILEVSFPEAEGKARTRRPAAAERAFRATVYDYDGQRTLRVDGTVGEPSRWAFTELATQPAPTGEPGKAPAS